MRPATGLTTPDAAMIHPKAEVNIHPTIQIVLRIDLGRGEVRYGFRNVIKESQHFVFPTTAEPNPQSQQMAERSEAYEVSRQPLAPHYFAASQMGTNCLLN